MTEPTSRVEVVRAFLGGDVDAARMAGVIESRLYRQRRHTGGGAGPG
jgi:hypothetical protein